MEALPHREKYGPIAAFWHTEIGPLNQIIHVWGYENLEERDSVRAAAAKDPNWPPKITPGNILNMNSEIWNPAPFMKPMGGDQALGGIYEMRTYTYEPGSIPELLKRWETTLFYIAIANHKTHFEDPPDPSEEGSYTLSVTDVTGASN